MYLDVLFAEGADLGVYLDGLIAEGADLAVYRGPEFEELFWTLFRED